MVTDWALGVLGAFLQTVLGPALSLIPDVPAWTADAFSALGQVWSVGQSMDAWIPVSFTFGVVGVVFAVYAVTLIIGTVKLVASYLTLGGGAT